MSTRSEARNITATCSLGAGVDRASIRAGINGFPSCEVNFHVRSKGGDAGEALSSDEVSALAGYQRSMFSDQSDPDMKVNMTDGKGGKLSFAGFTAAPSLSNNQSKMGVSVTAVHASSAVDALKMDIYTHNYDTGSKKPSTSASIAERIKDQTERLISLWEFNMSQKGEVERDLVKQIHSQNEPYIELWKKILKNSTETTNSEPFGKLSDNGLRPFNLSINNWICYTLLGNRPSFLQTMLALNSGFQMFYAPDIGDGVGQLRLMEKAFDKPKNKIVVIRDIDISLGQRSVLPIGQVLVTGLGNIDFVANAEKIAGIPPRVPGNRLSIFAKYPETGSKGFSSVPLPPYLPNPVIGSINRGLIGGPGSERRTSLTAPHFAKWVATMKDFLKGPMHDLCTSYAKNVYYDLALAGSQAQIVTELDFGWKIGDYYSVSGAQGNLFKGVLIGIRHDMMSLQSSPTASTSLSFSHVQMDGFSIS